MAIQINDYYSRLNWKKEARELHLSIYVTVILLHPVIMSCITQAKACLHSFVHHLYVHNISQLHGYKDKRGSRGLMDRASDERSLHPQYHDWGETLEQGTEPPTAPRAPQHWLPTALCVCVRVCVCVCVFTCSLLCVCTWMSEMQSTNSEYGSLHCWSC